MAIGRAEARRSPWGPLCCEDAATLFGTRAAHAIWASSRLRPHQQAGHMTASAPTAGDQHPCWQGAVRIWTPDQVGGDTWRQCRRSVSGGKTELSGMTPRNQLLWLSDLCLCRSRFRLSPHVTAVPTAHDHFVVAAKLSQVCSCAPLQSVGAKAELASLCDEAAHHRRRARSDRPLPNALARMRSLFRVD
jgi:hypothetical protein